MIDRSDITLMYAAARVAFTRVFEAYKEYKDPSLDNAMKEILSIESILEKYIEEPNESEYVQDN